MVLIYSNNAYLLLQADIRPIVSIRLSELVQANQVWVIVQTVQSGIFLFGFCKIGLHTVDWYGASSMYTSTPADSNLYQSNYTNK